MVPLMSIRVNMFFKVQPGLSPQGLCAEMVLSIAWQGKQQSG